MQLAGSRTHIEIRTRVEHWQWEEAEGILIPEDVIDGTRKDELSRALLFLWLIYILPLSLCVFGLRLKESLSLLIFSADRESLDTSLLFRVQE